jgi:hypothetical protein
VHRLEDLLGDGLGLDERDEAELAVAFPADNLEAECLSGLSRKSLFAR